MTFPSKFGSVYPNPAGHWPTLHPPGPVPRSQKLPQNYSDDCGPHVATVRCPAKSWEISWDIPELALEVSLHGKIIVN